MQKRLQFVASAASDAGGRARRVAALTLSPLHVSLSACGLLSLGYDKLSPLAVRWVR